MRSRGPFQACSSPGQDDWSPDGGRDGKNNRSTEAMDITERAEHALKKLVDGLVLASSGAGPLLERDYWAVIRECRLTPPELADRVASDFCAFPPESLVTFARSGEAGTPLQVGDEMEVSIRMAGECRVRVLHRNENSITLGTLEGHPEAGRITFGAYRNDEGDVIFHIRSRARAESALRYVGWVAAGEPMQTNTWTDFIDRVAHTVGGGVIGAIHADTREIEDEGDEPETTCSPTFIAVGS